MIIIDQDQEICFYTEQNVDDFEGSYDIETVNIDSAIDDKLFEEDNESRGSVPGHSSFQPLYCNEVSMNRKSRFLHFITYLY